MKVVCVKEFNTTEPISCELTYGRTYEIQPKPKWGFATGGYFIRCDKGYVSVYNESIFVTIFNLPNGDYLLTMIPYLNKSNSAYQIQHSTMS